MSGAKSWSLGFRLTVSVLTLGTAMLVAIGVTSYVTAREALVASAEAQAQTLADSVELAIEKDFASLTLLPEAIAVGEQRPLDGKARKEQLRGTLPRILERVPMALGAYVFFEPGVIPGEDLSEVWFVRDGGAIKPFASNIPSSPGYDPSRPIYDYRSQAWYTQARGAGGTVWTEPFVDTASGVAMVSGTAPVTVDGRQIGVAGLDVDLTTILTTIEGTRPTEHSYALLVGRDGTIIASPRWPGSVLRQTIDELAADLDSPDLARLGRAMLAQQHGLTTIADPETGAPSWASYQPILSTGWSVAIVIPQPDLLGSVSALGWRVAALAAGGLILMALLLTLLSRSLTRPLTQLIAAARTMAAGDLGQRVAIDGAGELGTLGRSFNAMAEALAERIVAEQAAQRQAQQLQQAEVESRQQLEQAVAEYLEIVKGVTTGDLTRRIEVRQGGALGQLGQGLNGMVESLHRMTRQVHMASTNITAAAAAIVTATTQQAASSAEQSAAIAQTSATLEEVKQIAAQTTRQADQLARDSEAALQVAQEGTHVVEETVSGMGAIRARVDAIAQTIIALAEQSESIGSIITTVSELADQSNLLALNAAIEAARAGEQGKSFAVVALHVRQLAERSKQATAQVGDILREIQKATNAAVLVTREGTRGAEAGSQLAEQAGEAIRRIAHDVEGGAQANKQIVAAAQQQTAGMEQIRQAMGSIQQATSQALASTRQAERAAQDLRDLAGSLQQTVATYRL